jgi:uncharacterized protein YgbK (DUF1537 family)
MRVAAIADDTTGALEVGAKLAAAGFRALVSSRFPVGEEAEALVIDAQSRRKGREDAYRTVRELATGLRDAGVEHLYKKTDSTLRGNIAAEFQALVEVFPERLLVYAPAYPQMGRIVRGGELFVHGKPLRETDYAADALNPAQEGRIPVLLAAGCRAPVVAAGVDEMERVVQEAPAGAVVVCDGERPEDLIVAARAVAACGRPCVVAGTAGFCESWARVLAGPRRGNVPRIRARRRLIASGSRNPVSRAQIERAAELGIPVRRLEAPDQDEGAAQALSGWIEERAWAAVCTSGTSREDVTARIGQIVRRVLENTPVEGLVIFGGDTAWGVLQALGVESVRPEGELLPGLPVSKIGLGGREVVLITKAGGFGGPELAAELRAALE